MITVYGTDWCEDTRRTLRHLRRLSIPHRYLNVDEDLAALQQAQVLNGGKRRTPTVDLGIGGSALVEPDNDTLTGALVEMQMLTQEDAADRLEVQNVGDVERVARTVSAAALVAAAAGAPPAVRAPLRLLGAALALTGISGWCPAYHVRGITSLGGPGDRPAEALRESWTAPRETFASRVPRDLEEAS